MAASSNATLGDMYAGIDIGGTKTLVAVFDEVGTMTESTKFPTPSDYTEFIRQLTTTVASFTTKKYIAGGLAMPVSVYDREQGIAVAFGNLPWKNVDIQADVEAVLDCPVFIDNDAKLGALYQAVLLKDTYKKVLYVTVSTGIGYAFVNNGIIDENVGDGGGRTMLFEHDGHMVPWESFASGHAIVDRYGKKAMDITDAETWTKICRDLSVGFIELIAILQPEVIVIGGSVGTYFDRYGSIISEELKQYDLPLVPIPPIVGAQQAEEAVVYGCYELIKVKYVDGKATS
jgi:predicted NBD/HSP70 family sugar kinase